MVLDKYVETLINEVLMESMYSKGVLNSEGRKVLELLARALIREHPELKRAVGKIRRSPTRENILKFVLKVREEYLHENDV